MLNVVKKITLDGQSVFDGKIAQGYSGSVDNADPDKIQMNTWIGDYEVYKQNRETCQIERAQFEDQIYEIQNELKGE